MVELISQFRFTKNLLFSRLSRITTTKLDILRGNFGTWFMVFRSILSDIGPYNFVEKVMRLDFLFFFLSSWIRKKFECKRNFAGLVWWEIKNVLHVRVHTCKYAISGLKMVQFFFSCSCCHPCLHDFRVWFPSQVSNSKSCGDVMSVSCQV